MTIERIVRFKDKLGKWHKYCATYIDGKMIPSDWDAIQKIMGGTK